jgi:hypothetical protein
MRSLISSTCAFKIAREDLVGVEPREGVLLIIGPRQVL